MMCVGEIIMFWLGGGYMMHMLIVVLVLEC